MSLCDVQAAILKSLKELAAGRTCVFVAHRLYVKYVFITTANCIAFAVLTPSLCFLQIFSWIYWVFS